MAYDSNNIFAKILRGEIPCHNLYEDEYSIAFLDVMPRSDGHALVLPKMACRNLLDIDPQALSEVIKTVQRIAIAAKAAFSADGIMVEQRNEPAAGQEVFHLHFHIIPRHEGITLRDRKMADADVLGPIAERFRTFI